jgi:DNA-binding LacI/PurR family transcriptional regulator
VRHLVELGHRRIALIGGDTEDPMRFTPPHHRRVGYLEALREAGIDYDPRLEILGYFTVDGGEAATRSLLELRERPSALFAESDEMAYGAMRAIRRAGLRVPQDVAVIGFDDHASAELLDLSTVRQPVIAQAEDLTARILAAIAEPDSEPLVKVLQTELVVRGSTDPRRSVY